MERLSSFDNLSPLLVACAFGLLGFVAAAAFRAFNIRQRMIRLRRKGLVRLIHSDTLSDLGLTVASLLRLTIRSLGACSL